MLPALAAGGVAAVTMLVNEPINERWWSDAALDDDEVEQMIERWARWHDVRLALGAAGVVAGLLRSQP